MNSYMKLVVMNDYSVALTSFISENQPTASAAATPDRLYAK